MLACAAPASSQSAPSSEGQTPDQAPTTSEASQTETPEVKKKRNKRKREKKLSRREMRRLEEALPKKFQQWLDEVHFLISDEEKRAFLEITEDYQRDAFIERFWRIRDRFEDTARNEFREHWYERLHYAKEEFGDLREDRARMFLLNGPPDGRIEFQCTTVVYPLEIWYYDGSERVSYEHFLLFYRRNGGQRYYLWRPSDGVNELLDFGVATSQVQDFFQEIRSCRDGDTVAGVLARLLHPNMRFDYEMLLAKTERPRETPQGEWIETFESYSTELPEDAKMFEAKLDLEFSERYQARTVMKATLGVPVSAVGKSQLAGHSGYNFSLNGEILKEGALFDQFRYRYDLPAEQVSGDELAVVFQRRLRPGSYELVVKLEDMNGKGFFRYKAPLEVPRIDDEAASLPTNPEDRTLLEAARLAAGTEIPTLQIVEPYGTMQVGMVRFDTLVTGKNIDEVRFALDGRVVLQKRRPPYSVELDLGTVPRIHELRVSAHDEEGNELTSDEITLNAGQHQFKVHLIEPRRGVTYRDHVDVEAAVLVPEDRVVERVEIYLAEDKVATLYQEPWIQRVQLPEGEQLSYIRAVAYLPDGNSTDALEYINAPDYLENVQIEFVELFATVLDRGGHPLQNMTADEFRITEDGEPQVVQRFEKVENLPIHTQVMLDVSASMKERIDETRQAALQFFESSVTPKDRASLVTFNDHPHLAVKFTNETDELAGGLAGLKAERGTALYDAVVFGLYYMNGLKGQKALLLLSDGKDESSKFGAETALEYARRAGVVIYSIGLDIRGKDSGASKRILTRLADETGGRSFFIKDTSELARVYETIDTELRSRYLLAYQSTNTSPTSGFRTVELKTTRAGTKAKTMRGYYP